MSQRIEKYQQTFDPSKGDNESETHFLVDSMLNEQELLRRVELGQLKAVKIAKIGSGYSGCVQKCKIGENYYAIKTFNKSQNLDSRIKELDNLKNLKDCEVVEVLAEDPKRRWLIFPLFYDRDLFDFVTEIKKPFEEDISKTLFRKILSPILKIHEKGYVHRDIKLENFLIDPQTLNITICDMGFAEELQQDKKVKRVGTSGYMAPELYKSIEQDQIESELIGCSQLKSADIFALGVVLFFLTFGYPPFESTDPAAKCQQWNYIKKKKWDVYWKQVAKLPLRTKELKQILQRMLDPEPQNRPNIQEIVNINWLNSSGASQESYQTEMKTRQFLLEKIESKINL